MLAAANLINVIVMPSEHLLRFMMKNLIEKKKILTFV